MLRAALFGVVALGAAANGAGPLAPDQLNVIQTLLECTVRHNAVIVVSTQTVVPVAMLTRFEDRSGGLTLKARSEGDRDLIVARQLWQAFKKENGERSELALLPAVSDVLLVSPGRLRALIPDSSDEAWVRFRAEWPHVGAVLRLTRPAISSDGRVALIYVTVTRGPLDGEGALVFLERESDTWVVKGRYVVIAS